ncbi:unnamed protein product [Nyctereutes procyonoides]|uniref:(raccoon dog) hypothetical protein n=1 Tax=Nyctereutes procyonoides TaxID=34880 RepID=A0A811YMR4_NYCPR|nr:unnamed protein product [Nyctereutes procyonoides]
MIFELSRRDVALRNRFSSCFSQGSSTINVCMPSRHGDTGHGWAGDFAGIQNSCIKSVYSCVPFMPVTLTESEPGISRKCKSFERAGVKNGILFNAIILGGFSQDRALPLCSAGRNWQVSLDSLTSPLKLLVNLTNVTLKTYEGMMHSLCHQEMMDIKQFSLILCQP